MNQLKLSVMLALMLSVLSACNNTNTGVSSNSVAPAGASTEAVAPSGTAISFVDTQEGKLLVIDATLFDTPQAKEFLATGKNPYIGNEEAIAKGHKIFGLYSCTQCHGPEAKGQVGPGLVGPDYKYPKDANNKGMFETIWHGTNGGMGAKGVGLMDPTDPSNGIAPDDMLKVIAWIRSKSAVTGNE